MKITISQLLIVITLTAVFFACVSSFYWFGPPRLRRIAAEDRLTMSDGQKIMPDDHIGTWGVPDSPLLYRCGHCENNTEVMEVGSKKFSHRDSMRFDTYTGKPKSGYHNHTDFYCTMCRRPIRIIGITYEISMMNPHSWFSEAVETQH